MKECLTCKETIDQCLNTGTFAYAHLYKDEKTMDIHIHDNYEIYYSISGGKQFLIDKHLYEMSDGDIFFINQYESHQVTKINTQLHERIMLAIHPNFLRRLSSESTNLDYCFTNRERCHPHRLHLAPKDQDRFHYYIHKLRSTIGFGHDVLDQAILIELMVFLNEIYINDTREDITTHNSLIDGILTYINKNIHDTLTIEALASHFHLSSSYLCRIFKSTTGTTINKYITAKRITLSKSLLAEGYSVKEVCEKCGFNDYSNYLKAFTKAVGISPKKYAQFSI